MLTVCLKHMWKDKDSQWKWCWRFMSLGKAGKVKEIMFTMSLSLRLEVIDGSKCFEVDGSTQQSLYWCIALSSHHCVCWLSVHLECIYKCPLSWLLSFFTMHTLDKFVYWLSPWLSCFFNSASSRSSLLDTVLNVCFLLFVFVWFVLSQSLVQF